MTDDVKLVSDTNTSDERDRLGTDNRTNLKELYYKDGYIYFKYSIIEDETNFYRFWKTERNQLGRLLRDKEVKGSNRLNSEKSQNAEQDFINFLHDFLKDKTTEEKEELLNTKSIIWFREQFRKYESEH